jgi:hypothetical protein
VNRLAGLGQVLLLQGVSMIGKSILTRNRETKHIDITRETIKKLDEIKEAIDLNDEIIRSLIVKTTDYEEHSTSKIANEDESEESEESDNSGEAKVEEPVKEEKKEEEEPVEEEKESAVEETEEKVEEEK